MLPKVLVEYLGHLDEKDKETVSAAGSAIHMQMDGARKNVLRDRKYALRFLRALIGNDGLCAYDLLSQDIWFPDELDYELSHDADLDISQIYTLHYVPDDDDDKKGWLHSHGLGEIGFFDFDIINPSADLKFAAADALRAIAFAIVEGKVNTTTLRFVLATPRGIVRFVDAHEFDNTADSEFVALRAITSEDENAKRTVLCEPAGRFFGRWSRKIRPSGFLSGVIEEGTLFRFSYDATELMADRARNTYSLLGRLADEFAEFEFPVLVKLGYRADDGTEEDKEHLWFAVNKLHEREVDATLESHPIAIERFEAGQRGLHPIDCVTDWLMLTPLGSITPRSTSVIRKIHGRRDQLLQLTRRVKNSRARTSEESQT